MEAKWNFHNLGLGNPDAPDKPNFPVKTLNTLMTDLGHKYIDILKVDAEGAAWDSFRQRETRPLLATLGRVVSSWATHSVEEASGTIAQHYPVSSYFSRPSAIQLILEFPNKRRVNASDYSSDPLLRLRNGACST